MGSYQTKATVARYSGFNQTGMKKPVETFEILGNYVQDDLGGQNFDRVLAEYMAD